MPSERSRGGSGAVSTGVVEHLGLVDPVEPEQPRRLGAVAPGVEVGDAVGGHHAARVDDPLGLLVAARARSRSAGPAGRGPTASCELAAQQRRSVSAASSPGSTSGGAAGRGRPPPPAWPAPGRRPRGCRPRRRPRSARSATMIAVASVGVEPQRPGQVVGVGDPDHAVGEPSGPPARRGRRRSGRRGSRPGRPHMNSTLRSFSSCSGGTPSAAGRLVERAPGRARGGRAPGVSSRATWSLALAAACVTRRAIAVPDGRAQPATTSSRSCGRLLDVARRGRARAARRPARRRAEAPAGPTGSRRRARRRRARRRSAPPAQDGAGTLADQHDGLLGRRVGRQPAGDLAHVGAGRDRRTTPGWPGPCGRRRRPGRAGRPAPRRGRCRARRRTSGRRSGRRPTAGGGG